MHNMDSEKKNSCISQLMVTTNDLKDKEQIDVIL